MSLLVRLCVVVAYLTIASSEESQDKKIEKGIHPAIVPNKQVGAYIDTPTNISCSSEGENPLQSCRWERLPPPNGKRYVINLKETTTTRPGVNQIARGSQDACNCTYNYIGKGLDKGDCSISINNVTEFHIAKWECFLIGRDSTWIGSLNITKQLGEKPYFKDTPINNGSCLEPTISSSTDITCCVDADDSKMSVTINFQLENGGDKQRASYVDPTNRKLKTSDISSFRNELICRRSRFIFRPEDNGKRLICIATFAHDSLEYTQTTYLPVNVNYGPILQSQKFTLLRTNNNSIIVNVTFMANPEPESSWYLKSDPSTGASFEIRKDHVKYKTNTKHLQGDYYSATLEIVNLETKDYRLEFLLTLLSACGTTDVLIGLSENDTHTQTDSYWIPIMMGIGIMIFLIIMATVLFFVIRQRVQRHGKYVPTQVTYSVK